MLRSLFRRLAIAVSCVLLLTSILPIIAFAKPLSAAQSHGSITITTDAPCSNPTVVVTIGISKLIPSVTVSGTLQLTSNDPNEANDNPPLKVYDTAGYFGPSTINVNSGSYTYSFTATTNDTFKACITGNGPDSDELGTITFKGLVTQKSSNYAGYVSSGLTTLSETYSEVRGEWTVPTAADANCSVSEHSYAGFWIGLGGVNAQPLEQIGTFTQCSHSVVTHVAFYEIVPDQTAQIIPQLIFSGDLMSAEVKYKGNGQFDLTINDLSRFWAFSTTQTQTHMNGALSSADWIAEAVTNNGKIQPLTNFGTVEFSLCFFEDNNPITTDPTTLKELMVDQNGTNTVKAQSSDFLDYGDISFDVTWKSAGP